MVIHANFIVFLCKNDRNIFCKRNHDKRHVRTWKYVCAATCYYEEHFTKLFRITYRSFFVWHQVKLLCATTSEKRAIKKTHSVSGSPPTHIKLYVLCKCFTESTETHRITTKSNNKQCQTPECNDSSINFRFVCCQVQNVSATNLIYQQHNIGSSCFMIVAHAWTTSSSIHISFITDLLIQHQFVDIIFNHTQSTLLHYLLSSMHRRFRRRVVFFLSSKDEWCCNKYGICLFFSRRDVRRISYT